MSKADPWAQYETGKQDQWSSYEVKSPDQAKEQTVAESLVNGVVDYAKGLNRTLNPFSEENRAGAASVVYHPIDTMKNALQAQGQLYEAAKQSFQNEHYLEGVRHAVAYMLPIIGPAIDEAGNKAEQGKLAEGLGEATGIGINTSLAARSSKPPAPTAGSSAARDLYYQAIKPGLKSQINTAPEDVRAMVATGLGNQIPVSEAGATKLTNLAADLNKKIDATIASRPADINKFDVARRLGPVADKFSQQVNPASDLNAVAKSGNEFLENQPNQISAVDAQTLKKGTYQQLSDKAYGEMQTAQIEAQKALARGLKEELATQFPEIKDLNVQEAKLYDLEPVLQRAVNKAANNRSTWLKDAATIGVGKAVTGSGSMGVGLGILRHIMSDPEVQSKLAIAINKGAGAKSGGIAASIGKVNTFLNSLNSSQSEQGNEQ